MLNIIEQSFVPPFINVGSISKHWAPNDSTNGRNHSVTAFHWPFVPDSGPRRVLHPSPTFGPGIVVNDDNGFWRTFDSAQGPDVKPIKTPEQISGFTRCQTEQALRGAPGKTSDAVISSHIFKLKNPSVSPA